MRAFTSHERHETSYEFTQVAYTYNYACGLLDAAPLAALSYIGHRFLVARRKQAMRNTRSAHGPPTTNAATWESSEECIYCSSDAFQAGYGPRTLVMCACCSDRGAHVLCHEQATGELFTEEDLKKPSFQWFCSNECASISRQLVQLQGVRRPVCETANICVELVRYSQRNRGTA